MKHLMAIRQLGGPLPHRRIPCAVGARATWRNHTAWLASLVFAGQVVAQPQPEPPVITNQPKSQIVALGSNALFTVGVAASSTPLAFEWRFNTVPLPGATNLSLLLSNVHFTNQGSYSVLVTNKGGQAISSNASLTVLYPPHLVGQPLCQAVPPGGTAVFQAAVSSTSAPPLRLQWRRNGSDLEGATNDTLTLPGVRLGDEGIYSLLVRNPASAVVSQPAALSVVTSGLGSQWEGMVYQPVGFLRPPSPHGAVGPAGIIATVNLRIACYQRAGALCWGPMPLALFFSPAGTSGFGLSDPKVAFDLETSRFYVVMQENPFGGTESFLNLAVSRSGEPASGGTSDWFFFRVPMSEATAGSFYGGDYPSVGVDAQAVSVAVNTFTLPLSAASRFRHCQVFVFDKAALNRGELEFRRFTTPDGFDGGFTLQPASLTGAGGPANVVYFAETPYTNSTMVRVWAIANPFGDTPGLVTQAIPVPDNGGGISGAPQPLTTNLIDTVSPLTQGQAVWLNDTLWFCHTAGRRWGRSSVYYYQIRLNGFPAGAPPTLLEVGRIQGDRDAWTYQPALGANRRGDLCLVYSQSSSSDYPTIRYTTRRAGLDRFDRSAILKFSVGPTVDPTARLARWGDYAVVAADPVDDSFWLCHEWVPAWEPLVWSTWWGNVTLPTSLLLLTNPGFDATGFHFQLIAPSGAPFTIYYSEDALRWDRMTSSSNAMVQAESNGVIRVTDPGALERPQRLYRATSP